jgi:hypothetical protein
MVGAHPPSHQSYPSSRCSLRVRRHRRLSQRRPYRCLCNRGLRRNHIRLLKKPNNSEEDDVQWRHMFSGYYRLMLQSPPETTYKKGDRFHGWEGEDGVIAHILTTFDLKKEDKKEDKKQVKKVLLNVTEWASRGVNYKGQ